MKRGIIFVLLVLLGACSGLESKSLQLGIGSSKEDVLKVMGAPAFPDRRDGVVALRYASRIRLGYCDYREFFIYKDKVIEMNQYYHASIAGCTVGLQKIDWDPILAKVAGLKKD